MQSQWVIEDLLPEGLTILAGKPKVGKSFLAQHLSGQIAIGGLALNRFRCNYGQVLHLALEDTKRRFQKRMRTQMGGEIPRDAHYALQWEHLPRGADEIDRWLSEQPRPRAIIIDVFTKLRAPEAQGSKESVYERDYKDATHLKRLSDKHGVAVLLLHHQRKAQADDRLDSVSGSAGLTGAADAVWTLVRPDRSKMEAILDVSGRDIGDLQYALTWDKKHDIWVYAGTPESRERQRVQNAILEIMRQLNRPLKQAEIAERCGFTRQKVSKHIKGLVADGLVVHSAHNWHYILPPTE